MVVTYVAFGLGITVGYHRLLTHRAFQTSKGCSTASPCSARWASRARSWTGSPTTASTTPTPTRRAIRTARTSVTAPASEGLWHAHTGWLLETHGQADWKQYAAELYEDPGMRRIGRMFPWLAYFSIAIPTALGFVLHGFTLEGALRGLVGAVSCARSSCTT